MQEFQGRVAVVTGAASGIGRALAQRCAREGMSVVLADVDERGLAELGHELEAQGAEATIVPTDVSRAEQLEKLAQTTARSFRDPHLVFNNAGVLTSGAAWEQTEADWQWVLGVNLWGVVHGVRSFVPRMLAHGEPAHMVNTASIAGLMAGPMMSPYMVSKHGVVALSEALNLELAGLGAKLGVSILCPGAVATGIGEAERNRPRELGASAVPSRASELFASAMRKGIREGVAPERIADFVFAAICENRFWILPDSSFNAALEDRFGRILAASKGGL